MQNQQSKEILRFVSELNAYTNSDDLYDLPYEYEECDFTEIDDSLKKTDPRIILVAGTAYIIGLFEIGKSYEENPNMAAAHVSTLQIPSANQFVFDAELPWLKKRLELFKTFCYKHNIVIGAEENDKNT